LSYWQTGDVTHGWPEFRIEPVNRIRLTRKGLEAQAAILDGAVSETLNRVQKAGTSNGLEDSERRLQVVDVAELPEFLDEQIRRNGTGESDTPPGGDLSGNEAADDTDHCANDDQTALQEFQVALDDQQATNRKIAIAHRRVTLLRILAPSEKAPEWVAGAIDWVAQNGRKPVWAELGRHLARSPRTMQKSLYFGSHPDFEEAIDEALQITSD
jgi:hypothetical protein